MNDPTHDPLTADLLQAVIVCLRQDVVPFLSDPSARVHADLATRVLYMLQNRFSRRGQDLQQLLDDDAAVLAQLRALVPEAFPSGSTVPPAPAATHFSAIERLEQAVLQTESQINDALPAVIEVAQHGAGERQQSALRALDGMFTAQKAFLAAQDPDILKGSHVCYQGGVIEQERPFERPAHYGQEMTAAHLQAHLQARFPGCRVENMSVMAGGFSKTTIFFTQVSASGESTSLVMRKDVPAHFVSSVENEFPLLQQLYRAGFPVAEPCWIENDPAPFGGRFMASRRVKGSNDIKRWAGDPQAVERFARELAKTMARLHAIPLTELGYAPAVAQQTAFDALNAEIERWHDVLRRERHGREAYPLEEMAFAWLKANVPSSLKTRQACLAHGDIGFHNLMIDEGQVTALLDWEFAHPSDPIEDLLYTKPFIERVMDWERFKGYYREFGGASCTAEEEAFYDLWSKSRNPITSLQASNVFAKSMPDNIKFASAGFVLGRYLGLEAGELVLQAMHKA